MTEVHIEGIPLGVAALITFNMHSTNQVHSDKYFIKNQILCSPCAALWHPAAL
jgi:hypothetical protein